MQNKYTEHSSWTNIIKLLKHKYLNKKKKAQNTEEPWSIRKNKSHIHTYTYLYQQSLEY